MTITTSTSTYHSILRIAVAVVAIVLVFVSGVLSPTTAELARHTEQFVASAVVGVSVGVPPNEVNQITAAMTARQHELDQREQLLAQREIAVGLSDGTTGGAPLFTSTFVLSIVLFILLVLMVLNYVLDYLRSREQRQQVEVLLS